MDNVLNGHGLGLAYAAEPAVIELLDQERIFEDLAEGAYDALVFRPERWRLADHDHLVLARASRTGRYLGLLAASMDEADGVAFLNIETAFVAPSVRVLDLFQRMLAVVVLRIEGADAAPAVISACTGNRTCLAALRAVAANCPGSVLFPEADGSVVTLRTVALARRVARRIAPQLSLDVVTGRVPGPREQVLAVLDLRGCPPGQVVEAARARCRTRPTRAAWRAALGAPGSQRRAAEGWADSIADHRGRARQGESPADPCGRHLDDAV